MAGGGGEGEEVGKERRNPVYFYFFYIPKNKGKKKFFFLSDNIFIYKLQPLIYIQYHENPFKLIGVTCIPMPDEGSNEIKIPDNAF